MVTFFKAGFYGNIQNKGEVAQQVVCGLEGQQKIISEFYESWWAGHHGIWESFSKIKEKYKWKDMYKDVVDFLGSCKTCQLYSNVRHRDGLHPTYLLAIHYKWVVDLGTMPMGLGQKKFLALAQEDSSNQVERRALQTKRIETIC